MDTFRKKRNIEQREWPTNTIKNIGIFFSEHCLCHLFFSKFIFKNRSQPRMADAMPRKIKDPRFESCLCS